MSSVLDRLHGLLRELKLFEADTLVEAHLERASQGERSYADFLLDLLEAEALMQRDRLLSSRLRQAKLPFVKTLEQFDFSFQPSIEERQIRELRTLRFVHEAANVLFLGPPGVGKTHLAVGLAIEAVRNGFSTLFITAHELVTDLGKAAREGRLDRKLRYLVSPKVLVVDEIG